MISKSQIKLITGLQHKKYRDKSGFFLAEGPKIIMDLLDSGLELEALYASESHPDLAELEQIVSVADLKKVSALKNPNTHLAVFNIPKQKTIQPKVLTVALDAVRDPGNLGTIIRLCDWFGVQQMYCSPDTVDCYNPKVVQATMGSIARVTLYYGALPELFERTRLPVYGAVMDGTNVYTKALPPAAILLLGNEANGISSPLMPFVQHKITIPAFGSSNAPESLNVATATAVLLSEFRRTTGK
ncbi:MAG: RNA methyltransferase [Flavobacteriaceae bacterium]|nr:RNA methyltransferase [Flavobacteriaceae bacterium]